MGHSDDHRISRCRTAVLRAPALFAGAAAAGGAAQHFPARSKRGSLSLRRAVHVAGGDDRNRQYRRRGDGGLRGRPRGTFLDDGRGVFRHGDAVCRGVSCRKSAQKRRALRRTVLLHRASALRQALGCRFRADGRGGGASRRWHAHTGQQYHKRAGGIFLFAGAVFHPRQSDRNGNGSGWPHRDGDCVRGAARRCETDRRCVRADRAADERAVS